VVGRLRAMCCSVASVNTMYAATPRLSAISRRSPFSFRKRASSSSFAMGVGACKGTAALVFSRRARLGTTCTESLACITSRTELFGFWDTGDGITNVIEVVAESSEDAQGGMAQ